MSCVVADVPVGATVVERAPPLISIWEPMTNPVPLTVSVGGLAVPACTPVGLNVLIEGTGLFAVNGTMLDVPPSGGGFTTAIINDPASAMSEEVIATSSSVLF